MRGAFITFRQICPRLTCILVLSTCVGQVSKDKKIQANKGRKLEVRNVISGSAISQ